MSRIVTAVYRTYAVADLVRRELLQIGVAATDVTVIPGADEPLEPGGFREDQGLMDTLCELDLPDSDTRDYQQCVRRGDYVVSARVGNELVDRAREIMRDPEREGYDLEALSREFEDRNIIRHTVRSSEAGARAERDAPAVQRNVRSYRMAGRTE